MDSDALNTATLTGQQKNGLPNFDGTPKGSAMGQVLTFS